jgi:cysteine-rich repeat protein
MTLVIGATTGCFKGGEDEGASGSETVAATMTGTGSDSDSETGQQCPEGEEGCACLPGDTCAEGLMCSGTGVCTPAQADTDMGGAVCGDSVVEDDEECDDGPNNADDQACTASCQMAMCGDALVLAGVEECDTGVQSETCDSDCTVPECGDGIVNALAGETCDDGNLDPADDCTDQCLLATCGDGVLNAGEECDDGNVAPDDDCTPDCKSLWWAEGPQINIVEDNLVGWELCWSGLFGGQSPTLTQILGTDCTKAKLLIACRPVATGEITLLAMGDREAVTFDTSNGNIPYNHNGVGWYYNNSYSWGFALEGDTIQRNSCDIGADNPQFRMCWHTGNDTITSGYRCGENTGLFNNTWARLVFQAD